eukprot:365806-Chlamydomonas_euryale.AAC.18
MALIDFHGKIRPHGELQPGILDGLLLDSVKFRRMRELDGISFKLGQIQTYARKYNNFSPMAAQRSFTLEYFLASMPAD